MIFFRQGQAESKLRTKVVKGLSTLKAFPVENSAHIGTPDIYFSEGWIEIKVVKEFPKKETTPIRIDHFTATQREFLERHYRLKKNSFLFVQVEENFFLFDGFTASKEIGTLTKQGFYLKSMRVWNKKINFAELIKIITNRGENDDTTK
jgi:hypothetical protein